MALKIKLTNNKGQDCEYHKIIGASQVFIGEEKGININLASYTNQDYRQQDEVNMIVSNTPIFLPFETEEDFSRTNLYARIKAEINEFSTALDV